MYAPTHTHRHFQLAHVDIPELVVLKGSTAASPPGFPELTPLFAKRGRHVYAHSPQHTHACGHMLTQNAPVEADTRTRWQEHQAQHYGTHA
eukprot:14276019-Alexandrium_andersonii.AAC.1